MISSLMLALVVCSTVSEAKAYSTPPCKNEISELLRDTKVSRDGDTSSPLKKEGNQFTYGKKPWNNDKEEAAYKRTLSAALGTGIKEDALTSVLGMGKLRNPLNNAVDTELAGLQGVVSKNGNKVTYTVSGYSKEKVNTKSGELVRLKKVQDSIYVLNQDVTAKKCYLDHFIVRSLGKLNLKVSAATCQKILTASLDKTNRGTREVEKLTRDRLVKQTKRKDFTDLEVLSVIRNCSQNSAAAKALKQKTSPIAVKQAAPAAKKARQ